MQTFIAFLFIFGIAVLMHELGHFLVAKWFDIKVSEFAIGLGPKLVARQYGETTYRLNLIPLGGYVNIVGMDPEEEQDCRGFNSKPLWQRFWVIFTGPLMNFLLAIFLFFLVFYSTGVPSGVSIELGDIQPQSPAIEAGLQSGDQIIAVNNINITDFRDLVNTIETNPNQELLFQVERDGDLFNVTVIPSPDPDTGLGKMGSVILERPVLTRVGILPAFRYGFSWTFQVVRIIGDGLRQMIAGTVAPDFTGPVGIAQLAGEAARAGIVDLLWLAGILSVNLGLFNLLPIPALDGGRLLFFVVELFRGRPVDPKKEQFVHYVGFVLMMVLFLLVTYKDILELT